MSPTQEHSRSQAQTSPKAPLENPWVSAQPPYPIPPQFHVCVRSAVATLWRIHSCWNAQICYQRFMPLCSMLVGGDFPPFAFPLEQHLGNALFSAQDGEEEEEVSQPQKKSPLSRLQSFPSLPWKPDSLLLPNAALECLSFVAHWLIRCR